MHDETYAKFDYSTLPGPQFYTIQEGQKPDKHTRSISVEKFGKKAMIWQAICECGMKSSVFITNQPMNA